MDINNRRRIGPIRNIKDNFYHNLIVTSKLKLPRVANLSTIVGTQGSIVFNRDDNVLAYHNGVEWVSISTNTNNQTECISESVPNTGVVIEKPLFVNRHGIGSLKLSTSTVTLGGEDVSSGTLDGSNFTLQFESNSLVGPNGPSLVLQNNNIFTAPAAEDYPNTCLEYTTMYVQFNLVISATSSRTSLSAPTLVANILRDGAIYKQCPIIPTDVTSSTESFSVIVALSPGQTINIGFTFIQDSNVLIYNTFNNPTFIDFAILGFET